MDVLCLFALVREHLLPVQSCYVRQPLCPLCVRVRVDMCACLCVICNNCVCVCVWRANNAGPATALPASLRSLARILPHAPLSHTRARSQLRSPLTLLRSLAPMEAALLARSVGVASTHGHDRHGQARGQRRERSPATEREREREREREQQHRFRVSGLGKQTSNTVCRV